MPTQPVSLRLEAPPAASGLSVKQRLTRALNDNFLHHLRATLAADSAADVREACEAYLDHSIELSKPGGVLDERLPVAAVFAGAYHSFALTTTGNVYAFGLNNMGQLGLGSLEPNHTGTPTLVTALEGAGIAMLAGGEHHSLALSESGATYAFGRGDNNQLGFDDGTDQQVTPRLVPALEGIAVRKVGTSANSNVALARSGDLYTWGFGEMGQLANGKGGDEPSPTLVEASKAGAPMGGMAVLDAASGGQHMVLVGIEGMDH